MRRLREVENDASLALALSAPASSRQRNADEACAKRDETASPRGPGLENFLSASVDAFFPREIAARLRVCACASEREREREPSFSARPRNEDFRDERASRARALSLSLSSVIEPPLWCFRMARHARALLTRADALRLLLRLDAAVDDYADFVTMMQHRGPRQASRGLKTRQREREREPRHLLCPRERGTL